MTRIVSSLLVSYLLMASLAFGQAGQTGLTFLKLGVGGRSLGMGEAYTAVAADPSATYYNPATLSLSTNPQLLLMHKESILDTKTEYLAASTMWKDFTFGLSINATSVNEIPLRSRPGPAEGTFSARNTAIGLSASYAIDPSLSVGITGKYLYEKILVDEASGFAVDLGGLYRILSNLRIGASISNLGSMDALQNESSTLPRIVRIGVGYDLPIENIDSRATLASDVVSFTQESITHVSIGGEFEYQRTIAVRAGYQTGYEWNNVSAGVGVRYKWLRLDYAFVPLRYDLGTTHTLSLGISFE